VFAFAGGGHFVKRLQDGHIRFNGSQCEFAAEVLTEGFGGDADEYGDLVLRDAAASEEAGEFAVFGSGLE
jgi:hypothetical protein